MKLERKNIVITGGTSGVGLELVGRLHAGNRLLVVARNSRRLDNLAEKLDGVLTCRADLSRREDVETAAQTAREHFGQIDVVINNAAIQHCPTLVDENFSYESIYDEIGLNLTAVCALTCLLLPALMHDREAAVVNVNSGLALVPKKASAIYCATKAAVNVFSQSLRHQLEETNVKVHQAFLPLVATQMTEGRGDHKMSAADAADAVISGIEANILDHDIGRIRLLRILSRVAPRLASKIVKAA